MHDLGAAVHPIASFTLDRDWIIARAGVSTTVGLAIGRSLWDVWPKAEPIYRPIYEQAWRTGYADGRVFFMGTVVDVRATVTGDELTVVYDELLHLDITTLETLEASVVRMKRLARERDPAPCALRLVPVDLGEW